MNFPSTWKQRVTPLDGKVFNACWKTPNMHGRQAHHTYLTQRSYGMMGEAGAGHSGVPASDTEHKEASSIVAVHCLSLLLVLDKTCTRTEQRVCSIRRVRSFRSIYSTLPHPTLLSRPLLFAEIHQCGRVGHVRCRKRIQRLDGICIFWTVHAMKGLGKNCTDATLRRGSKVSCEA